MRYKEDGVNVNLAVILNAKDIFDISIGPRSDHSLRTHSLTHRLVEN